MANKESSGNPMGYVAQEREEQTWRALFEKMSGDDIAMEVSALVQEVDLANRGVKRIPEMRWRRMQVLLLVLQERAAAGAPTGGT